MFPPLTKQLPALAKKTPEQPGKLLVLPRTYTQSRKLLPYLLRKKTRHTRKTPRQSGKILRWRKLFRPLFRLFPEESGKQLREAKQQYQPLKHPTKTSFDIRTVYFRRTLTLKTADLNFKYQSRKIGDFITVVTIGQKSFV